MAECVKYGIQIPNRVFVGGIAFNTKEEELREFFSQYGKVKDCKIVTDKDGSSRGFGFVTFESKQEAVQTQKQGTVFFKEKKLNLGPAIRQKGIVFNNSQEQTSEPIVSSGVYMHPSGYCYTVAPNGMWYFHPNAEEPLNNQSIHRGPSQASTPPTTTCSPPPAPVNMYSTDTVQSGYPPPSQFIQSTPSIPIVPPQQPSRDIQVGYLPADPVGSYVQWYSHSPSPVNHFPLASPPPVPNHQTHAMHQSAYFLPLPNPRPEMYHFVTTPVETSLMERSQIMPYGSVIRPTPVRPTLTLKRMTDTLPPNEKRTVDSRFIPNGLTNMSHVAGNAVGVADK